MCLVCPVFSVGVFSSLLVTGLQLAPKHVRWPTHSLFRLSVSCRNIPGKVVGEPHGFLPPS